MPFIPFYDAYSSPYLVTFFIFALIETLLCSGITYGWASIAVVFKEERFYMDLCRSFFRNRNKTNEKIAKDSNLRHGRIVRSAAGYVNDGTLPGCPIQDARLNLIFTVSLFCLCGIKFPAGVFIDRCGPKIARSVGGAMYIIACIGLGFVAIGYENFLFPIFAFISVGGSLLVVAVYQVANIVYRKSRFRIICILHGAFDSSAVVMLIFKLMYERGLSLQQIMIGYSALCLALILLGTVFLIPPLQVLLHWIKEEAEINQNFNRRSSILAGPDFAVSSLQSYHGYLDINITNNGYGAGICIDEVKKLTNPGTTKMKYDTMEDTDSEITKNFEEDDGEPLVKSFVKTSRFKRGSVLHSVFSLLYFFELIFLLTFQLKLWYFVGSLTDFLERLLLNDKKTVSEYINLFGYIQFGGILITPVIGFVFDKSRLTPAKEAMLTIPERRLQSLRECIAPFLLTNLLCLLFCVLSMIEDIRFQVPSFILYTAVRGFLYADHGAFMGAALTMATKMVFYAKKRRFPASQFGTLYGLGIFIGGMFGVLQYALFELTSGPLKGNPFWTNIILLILVSLGNLHPFYLWWYVRSETKRIQSKRSITNRSVR